MMYALCEKYGIPFSNMGKWVVAQNNEQWEVTIGVVSMYMLRILIRTCVGSRKASQIFARDRCSNQIRSTR